MSMDANDIARQHGVDTLRRAWDAADVVPLRTMNGNASTHAKERTSHPGLVITCAADIKPRPIDWLWPNRLPRGKCVILAGEGGLGKSLTLSDIAARITIGAEWPCGESRSPVGSVIILSAEDDAEDTLVPRLMAAGADLAKVQILTAVRREGENGHRTFNLQVDLAELEKEITRIGDVLCIVIDPVTSYLGKVDSHKNAELRSVLEPLGEMAARRRVLVLANTHLSKGGGSANNNIIGSVAFVNHARAAFIVTADAEDNTRRLFIPSKTNIGKKQDGLAYRIGSTFVGEMREIEAPYVMWESGPVTMTADQALDALGGGENRSEKAEAMDFLRAALADGPVAAKELQKMGREDGHSKKSLRSAREALGVTVRRDGFGPGSRSVWSLPESPSTYLPNEVER